MWESISSYFVLNPETGLVVLTWPVVVLLVIAGFLTGVINTLAGSGTVITYSLFMFLGLPANIANGTNRFGVILQTFSSSATFWKNGKLDTKKGLWLAIPIVLGTLIGAHFATHMKPESLEIWLGIFMLIMLVFVFYNPEKWLIEQIEKTSKKVTWSQYVIFFLIGIYGGFIHIGVGIFLLVVLVLNAGYDLVKANGLKVFLVFLYSPFALAVFIYFNQVTYSYGLIAALGNIVGGILASKFAIRKGAGVLRWFLAVIIVLFCVQLFFF